MYCHLIQGNKNGSGGKTCHYFQDGKRQIDFILVCEMERNNQDEKNIDLRLAKTLRIERKAVEAKGRPARVQYLFTAESEKSTKNGSWKPAWN